MNAKKALRKVAQQEGISVSEVRKEIQAAIDEGMKSTDKSVQAYWSRIPRNGTKPTPEEVINFIAKSVKK